MRLGEVALPVRVAHHAGGFAHHHAIGIDGDGLEVRAGLNHPQERHIAGVVVADELQFVPGAGGRIERVHRGGPLHHVIRREHLPLSGERHPGARVDLRPGLPLQHQHAVGGTRLRRRRLRGGHRRPRPRAFPPLPQLRQPRGDPHQRDDQSQRQRAGHERIPTTAPPPPLALLRHLRFPGLGPGVGGWSAGCGSRPVPGVGGWSAGCGWRGFRATALPPVPGAHPGAGLGCVGGQRWIGGSHPGTQRTGRVVRERRGGMRGRTGSVGLGERPGGELGAQGALLVTGRALSSPGPSGIRGAAGRATTHAPSLAPAPPTGEPLVGGQRADEGGLRADEGGLRADSAR